MLSRDFLCLVGISYALPGFPMPCRDFPCFPRISHAFPGFPMLSRDFSGFWWHLLFGAVLFLLLYCARKAAGERKTSCIALALCLNFSTSSVRFLLASYTAVNLNIAQCDQKVLNWQQLCRQYFVWTLGALGMAMDGFESTFNLLRPLGCCFFQ